MQQIDHDIILKLFSEDNPDWKENSFYKHIGSLNLGEDWEKSTTWKNVSWLYENRLPKLKKVTWGDISKLQKEGKLQGFNQLQSQSFGYHYFLPLGWTAKPEFPAPGKSGMDFKNINGEYENICNYVNWDDVDYEPDEAKKGNLDSIYYHDAKAHWLVDSIRRDGLWNPIQGVVRYSPNKTIDQNPINPMPEYKLSIHPGSVRSPVFECLDDESLQMWVWDDFDLFNWISEYPLHTLLTDLSNHPKMGMRDEGKKNVSFGYTHGYMEISTELQQLTFRADVYEFNERIAKMAQGKRINIYIGYDSRHKEIAELNAWTMLKGIEHGFGGGDVHGTMKNWIPEIKFLDISKIPEYTREYAEQSTEFTYSRFLIPHLEDYKGFSIFLDDDILFQKSILPMFYFLNPDDAVACIKYDFKEHNDTKFDGEKNVNYPKKLWSSLMIFNNGHEDCKKLTPEVINTQTGKYLHQFEWTDKISEIPQHYIFTEGYDTDESSWRPSAVHFTRGGPWIDNMDISNIDKLEYYNRLHGKWLNYKKENDIME